MNPLKLGGHYVPPVLLRLTISQEVPPTPPTTLSRRRLAGSIRKRKHAREGACLGPAFPTVAPVVA
jgi:hypothetical protein